MIFESSKRYMLLRSCNKGRDEQDAWASKRRPIAMVSFGCIAEGAESPKETYPR